MAKTFNGEVQIHAQVDGNKIVITESSVRRDLELGDEEGIDCLPNSTIFEQLALMGKPKRKNTQVPQPSGPTDNVTDEAVYKNLDDSLVRAATTASSLDAEQDSSNITKTQSMAAPNEPSFQRTNSGGGPMVLDLEKTKTTQRNEIDSLKRRVKKLEKRNRSRTHKLKRLYKVGLSAKVESSGDKEILGEDASKQGRRIDAIDADEDITLVSDADNEMFDADDLGGEEVFVTRLKVQEQEQLSDVKKATLFQQILEKRRKHFAAKKGEEKRNKPPTQAQKRKIMCTYLKNIERYTLKQLKLKEFDKIQEMFDRSFNRVNTFKDFGTKVVERKEKRAGEELEQEITKKQQVEDDKEKGELKQLMKLFHMKKK
nr:hypothetical protein [Tanacetum cinerariifolium]